jgi:hypothetical protein
MKIGPFDSIGRRERYTSIVRKKKQVNVTGRNAA